MHRVFVAILCLFAALARPALAQSPAPALPHLGADVERTSVSGLSSGGFMAVQYAVAFSRTTIGAGVVAGGPYGCAMTPLTDPVPAARALDCMAGYNLSPAGSYMLALQYQMLGLIDPLENVRRQRLYLFHGKADKVVAAATMAALRTFYDDLKVPSAQIAEVKRLGAGHAFVTPDAAQPCSVTGPPFINRCTDGGSSYNQPAAILRHIFGPPPAGPDGLMGQTMAFDQTPYTSTLSSLDSTGYVYVPGSCRSAGAHCAVHIVFHGCEQAAGVDGVGDKVYDGLGYNGLAELYGLIMLYPQTAKTAFNPHGCWDWWGYDMQARWFMRAYPTREGTQLAAVHRMVEELGKAAE